MPLLALIAVTAIWGVTFVQVKDAVAVYPLVAFLAVRYAIAAGVLGLVGAGRVRSLGREGFTAGVKPRTLGHARVSRRRAKETSARARAA